jgi:ankyrin repeat protein
MPVKKRETKHKSRKHKKATTRRKTAVSRGGGSQSSQESRYSHESQGTWHTSPSTPTPVPTEWPLPLEEKFKEQMHNLIMSDSIKEFNQELEKKLKDVPYMEYATTPGGVTLLMDAASSSSFNTFMYLLNKGASIFAIDDGGRTPLIYATEYRNKDGTQEENENSALARVQAILSKLLQSVNVRSKKQKEASGIKQTYINGCDNSGYNALFYSMLLLYPKVTEALLEFGADIMVKYKGEKTPLILACDLTDRDMQKTMSMIILKKAMEKFVPQEGFPHFEGKLTPRRLTRYIAGELDSFVNAVDSQGRTALVYLCHSRVQNPEVAKILLRFGSDIEPNNNFGPLFEICHQSGADAYLICKMLLVEYLHRKNKFMEITEETIDTQSAEIMHQMGSILEYFILEDIYENSGYGGQDRSDAMSVAKKHNPQIYTLFQKLLGEE